MTDYKVFFMGGRHGNYLNRADMKTGAMQALAIRSGPQFEQYEYDGGQFLYMGGVFNGGEISPLIKKVDVSGELMAHVNEYSTRDW